MPATSTALPSGATLRRLAAQDMGAVAQIDAAITGRSRRSFFERRLEAALREPAVNLQFAVEQEGRVAGYLLARKLEGEFGRAEPALRLEIIGVAPGKQGKGLGLALLRKLQD